MAKPTNFRSLNQLCLTLTTCTLLGIAVSKPVDAAVMYSVTDIGTLGGKSSSAFDINDNGQVVGAADISNGGNRAFLWDSTNGIRNLDPFGTDTSFANRINNNGQVVGFSSGVGSKSQAFLWDSTNGLQNLGTLPGDISSAAEGINNNGQVVGRSDAPGKIQAFLGNGASGLQPLGSLNGYPNSAAYAINNNGQAVGFVSNSSSVRAVLWDGKSIQDLGSFGTYLSQANGINDRGEVVGVSTIDNVGYRAFLWDSTNGLQNLGTLNGYPNSYASNINNNGQVVGYTFPDFRALLWENGTVTDLNTLIDPNSGWTLGSATAINNKGQIVGEGLLNGQPLVHAFLLTPLSQTPERVPEPAYPLSLLAFGAMGVVSVLKRQQKPASSIADIK